MQKFKTFLSHLENQRLLILGFGREGQSTYKAIRKCFPKRLLCIADQNTDIKNHELVQRDTNVEFVLGNDYLQSVYEFDFVFKSPGVSFKTIDLQKCKAEISSQTDVFLQLYKKQVIAVTGTKGKSTTVSLIYHMLKKLHANTLLAGNIGIPFFERFDQIDDQTYIVAELSSHQLEFVSASPHIAILLNLFQEHLDHYRTYDDYQLAKLQIALHQQASDHFITLDSDVVVRGHMDKLAGFLKSQQHSISSLNTNASVFVDEEGNLITADEHYDLSGIDFHLYGHHNRVNLAFAFQALKLAGFSGSDIVNSLSGFQGLAHRLEFVGEYQGIRFFNDSIATIPQACKAAVEALHPVKTIILGGFDRGIDYEEFYQYLNQSNIQNFLLLGEVGKKIQKQLHQQDGRKILLCQSMEEVVEQASECTPDGGVCLLSPAASSYDMYKNFEHRGDAYKKMVSFL